MRINRRKFLDLAAKSAAVLSAANLLTTYSQGFFEPPSNRDVLLRFAIASDGHFGQPSTDYIGFHNDMIRWLNTEKRARGLDFVCINGDLIHDDASQLQPLRLKFNELTMPWYATHGNHDMINEEQWKNIIGTPWHYSFTLQSFAFIILNTADEKGTYICPDLAWTRNELDRHRNADAIFVFMHITPRKWTGAGIDCPELINMFSSTPNLKMIFHGHDHDQDDIKLFEGKPYFFDSHIGGSWGTDYRGYRVTEILKNGDILTYQLNPATQQIINRNTVDE